MTIQFNNNFKDHSGGGIGITRWSSETETLSTESGLSKVKRSENLASPAQDNA